MHDDDEYEPMLMVFFGLVYVAWVALIGSLVWWIVR